MNIYKFKIEVRSTKDEVDMEKVTLECFKNDSTKKNEYKEYVLGEWKKEEPLTQSIFSEGYVLAVVHEDQTKYYVAKVRANDDPRKIQYDILVISQAEKINDSIKKSFGSLKKKMKNYKISISDDIAYLYITDKNDIFKIDLAIKANVIVRGLDFGKRETVRLLLTILLFVISIIFANYVTDPVWSGVWISLIAASAFWLITEFLVKIHISKELEVNDLTNCIAFQPVEQSEDITDTMKIDSPKVEEDWGEE